MVFFDPLYTGLMLGTGNGPFNSAAMLQSLAPSSVAYLQPGFYDNGGAPLVLDRALVLDGPGVVLISP